MGIQDLAKPSAGHGPRNVAGPEDAVRRWDTSVLPVVQDRNLLPAL
jgi:hypothetical protein